MVQWYYKITKDPNDFYEPLGDAIEYFHNQYEEARKELKPQRGHNMAEYSADLAGVVEYRYGQLQELEAILEFVKIQYDKIRGERKRNFLEHYNRQLTDRQASERADIEIDVLVIREFIQQVALVRNLYLGISRGMEVLHYQLSNITKLRIAGLEDATF
jgi:hypothetical protein